MNGQYKLLQHQGVRTGTVLVYPVLCITSVIIIWYATGWVKWYKVTIVSPTFDTYMQIDKILKSHDGWPIHQGNIIKMYLTSSY